MPNDNYLIQKENYPILKKKIRIQIKIIQYKWKI